MLQRLPALSILCLSLGACVRAPAEAEAGAAAAAHVAVAASLTPEQQDWLARADASDGKSDGVVSNCLPCGLGMSGSPEHAARVGAQVLHLCSPVCLSGFVDDPQGGLQTLQHLYGEAR